ncbi:uncharacterized protein LOC107361372 [Tetranychus urticae]|nr:uncharacterized protein LOC107361372 [Tetranychus urticae]
MDFRRHSIQSLKSLKSVKSIKSSKEASNLSKCLLAGKNWFDTYLAYQKSLLPVDESTFILDILRDLFDGEVNDSIKLHLLSLLEQYFWLVSDVEKLEQTIGSLINVFQSSKSSDSVKCRYLYTCTVLWTCQIELVNDSLEGLLKSFTKTLVNLLNGKDNKNLSNAACQCLIQLEETRPGIIFRNVPDATIPRIHPTLLCLLLKNGSQFDPTIVKQLIGSLPRYNTDPYRLHIILNYLSDLMESKKQATLTPLVFKQFLPFFIHSTEAFHLHFSLLLLRSFGLELFSTNEELGLLHRLISLCTHPSLIIAHRLLFLDFAKSLLPILKSSHLADPHLFALGPFDGPDTQEKKLMILCQTEISDSDLITYLKTIESISISQSNRRATNALYRQLHFFLTVRPGLQNEIEPLLISMMMASPSLHIPYGLCLLDRQPALSARVSSSLVHKLLNMTNLVGDENKSRLKEYFLAIKWILKQPRKLLDSDKMLDTLNFCYDAAKQFPHLCKDLLSIIAVVIRHQTIDDKLKSLLNEILDMLMKNKNRVTISSWSQIYSIALNTLPNQENLRKVFCEEISDDDNLPLVVVDPKSNSIPLTVHEIKCTLEPVEVDCEFLAIPYTLKVSFNSGTMDEDIMSKLFGIELRLSCPIQEIDTVINIPCLGKDDFKVFQLKLSPIRVKPFTLNLDLRFGDINGVTYCCPQFTSEFFSFDRFMIPVRCSEAQFDKQWNFLIKQVQCHLTVQCFRNYSGLDQFLNDHENFKSYEIAPGKFVIGVVPNKMLLIRSIVVNGNLNFRMLTNLDKILKYLYYQFKQNN